MTEKQIIRRLYVGEGLSQAKTAEKLGISIPTLRRMLKKHGIVERHRGGRRRKVIDPAVLGWQ